MNEEQLSELEKDARAIGKWDEFIALVHGVAADLAALIARAETIDDLQCAIAASAGKYGADGCGANHTYLAVESLFGALVGAAMHADPQAAVRGLPRMLVRGMGLDDLRTAISVPAPDPDRPN